MSHDYLSEKRGMVLGVAILTAIICAIASYVVLFLAVSQARHARFYHQRVRARYATEAAIVWAQQQLRADEAGFCPNWANAPQMEGFQAQVKVTNCGVGNNHQIQARILNY